MSSKVPVSPRDVLRLQQRTVLKNERAQGQKAGDLFGGGAGDGADGATGGGGPGRPANDGGREGVREPGAGSDQAALIGAARGGEASGVSAMLTGWHDRRSTRRNP
jgi:hypothetical protein